MATRFLNLGGNIGLFERFVHEELEWNGNWSSDVYATSQGTTLQTLEHNVALTRRHLPASQPGRSRQARADAAHGQD